MQNNKLLLAKSFYLISILEWQVLIKIERISSQNLFNLEYNNVLINLEDHTIDHNFSYNFLPLLSLKSQLRLPMNYDFLDCFCEKVIYKSRENSFSNNIHKILTIIYNSRFIKSLDSCFSMDKISLSIKLADNLIGNHFLRCLIKELTPKICNIYLNIFNLQGCFMNEEEFLSKEFKEFILLLEKNFPDASRKLIIFIDLREISSQTQKEIPKILEILLELFSKYSNMNYFFISLPNLPLDKIVNTTIPLDFSDTKLLSLMLETICKDIGIKEISYENRSNYFQSISSLVSPENLKNIFVYAKKVQLKLNIIKKTVEP